MQYKSGAYFVYLLRCKNGSVYTGITTDVVRRVAQHKAGKGGRYTRAKQVSALLYQERHPNRSAAQKREAEIKKWPRARKLTLVLAHTLVVSLFALFQ